MLLEILYVYEIDCKSSSFFRAKLSKLRIFKMPGTDDGTSTVINMRVTANSIQGHRKYMEDCYKIRFQRESSLMNTQNKALLNAATAAGYFERNKLADDSDPQSDILFSYFGIFDGHGGKEASQFAKVSLPKIGLIVKYKMLFKDDNNKK